MNRRNVVLLAVFAALATSALLVDQPWKGDAFAQTRAAVRLLFPELRENRQEIARIEIRSAGRASTLVRSGGTWVVKEKLDHPAELDRLIHLVDSLSYLDTRDVVSINASNQETYAVDENEGTRIRILDASETVLADCIGGRLRSQNLDEGVGARLEFYVRPADEDFVVLAPQFHSPVVDPADWIEADLCPVEGASVEWISREDVDGQRNAAGPQSWKLERTAPDPDHVTPEDETPPDHAWRMLEPEARPALLYAGDSFVFSLTGLRGDDVVDRLAIGRRAEQDYGPVTDVFRAGVGDRVHEVYFGRTAPEGRRYAWIPGGRWVYLVGEFQSGQLRQSVASMVDDE